MWNGELPWKLFSWIVEVQCDWVNLFFRNALRGRCKETADRSLRRCQAAKWWLFECLCHLLIIFKVVHFINECQRIVSMSYHFYIERCLIIFIQYQRSNTRIMIIKTSNWMENCQRSSSSRNENRTLLLRSLKLQSVRF